jgi:hypothetical protein
MQFYWAWVNSSETTYGPTHARYDENVFSFTITHREGECAQLSLTIKNPKIGLLAAGRKVWGWLSFSDSGTAGAQPLFFGRLLGIPDMAGSATGFAELLTLTFVAKPIDFAAQRRALAEDLAVLPFYDKLFIDEKLRIEASSHTGDVDTALEARSARWHCSRGEDGLPLVVSISDICIGEDGTEIFESSTASPAGVDPTSVNLRIAGAPMTSVTVKASVGWTQQMPTGPAISIGSWQFNTFTGSSVLSGWPKPGSSLGGGWAAAQGTSAIDLADVQNDANSTYNFTWHNTAKKHNTGDPMSTSINTSSPVVRGPFISQLLYEDAQPGIIWSPAYSIPNDVSPSFDAWNNLPGPDSSGDVINIPLHYDNAWAVAPVSVIQTSLAITYEQGRGRTEHMNFTMVSDIQPVLTDPADFDTSSSANPPDETILELNGADVTVAIDGVAPLIDPAVANYFATPRGQQSTEYLLLRARALLLNGARLVEMSWSVPFIRAVNFTCRKNATLVWKELPGGQASGKISQYTISADGSSGKIGGSVTIMATVGRGAASETSQYTPAAGDLYVDTGYFADGYFAQPGQQVPLIGGAGTSTAGGFADVAYSPPVASAIDNPMPLTRDDVLVSASVMGDSVTDQANVIQGALETAASAARDLAGKRNATSNASGLVDTAMRGHDIWVEIVLRNVDSLALEDASDLNVQPLLVPQTINLEAPAG